jgi:hypothetical protein
MQISKFIKSLVPELDKRECLADCQITTTELRETVLPAYKAAEDCFKGYTFKSEEYDYFAQVYASHPMGSRKKLVPAIHAAVEMAIKNMDVLDRLIHEHFADESISAGLTARKANIVKALEAGSFFSKYARKWLINLYVVETKKVDGSDRLAADTKEGLVPAEVKWLMDNFTNFIVVMNALSEQPSQVHDRMMKIPEIIITDENEKTTEAQFGRAVLDPLSLGFIPVFMNPIYHVRMMVAEWQTKRYKAAKEELRVLQLRKLNLEKIQAGKPDARIQKEIEYTEERANNLSYDIAKMEEKYA